MSACLIVAFTGLIALAASVSGLLLPLEGASTMIKLVNGPEFKAAILPTTVNYPGSGSGAGKQWVGTGNANAQVMGFGDGAFSAAGFTMPSNVGEVPIAYGAMALYYNLPAIPATSCLSFSKQCQLWNANWRLKLTKWGDLLTGLPAAVAALPIRVVVRSDSSGSTNALKTYYTLVCGKFFPTAALPVPFKFAIDTNTAPPTLAPGYVGFDQTAGVVAAIQTTKGSVGYASCGQTRTASLIEMPLGNVLNTCSLCKNCVNPAAGAPYGPNVFCGNYGNFRVADPPNPCTWNNIVVNGDKDNDGDIYGVDIDNDNDGIQKYDFPVVFAEFAYFNKINTTPFCSLAKGIVKKMISSKFVAIYPKYSFVPLPINMRRRGCLCIKTFCGGKPTTMTGVLTAGGDCL